MAWDEDVPGRYAAYGWHTQRIEDGNDTAAVRAALTAAQADDRPSLIAVRTHIGYGSPDKQDSSKAHGAPLGAEEVRLTKEAYGWDPDKSFYVPDEALSVFRSAVPAGEQLVAAWEERLAAYRAAYPDAAAEFERRLQRRLPQGWADGLPSYGPDDAMATRNASQAAIQALAGPLPELFGGAADLSESNLTDVKDGGDFEAGQYAGRNLRFGVREHAMGAIASGLALHGGFLPYAGTFLNFSDYMRGAVRLAALSRLHLVYVWTHDSVGLGEDGPTHQPVEHYAALRAMPGLAFVRPGDPNEAIAAWRLAVEHAEGPVALSLTRQKLPVLPGTAELATEGLARGGYVLEEARDGDGTTVTPDVILMATGSELHLAVGARTALAGEGIRASVVSLPCWERFAAQPAAYRDAVLPPEVRARVSVEAGVTLGWDRWVGPEGAMIGLERYGASAPGPTVMEHFGFSVPHVAEVARAVLEGKARGPLGPSLDDPLPYGA
jgi:transketolase